MFEFDKTNKVPYNLIAIAKNYDILHFDNIPILVTGHTKTGQRVLASIMFDDTKKNISYHVFIFISEKKLNLFLKNKITYRDIILKSKEVFIVKHSAQNTRSYKIRAKDIPVDWLPTEDSFYVEE